MIHKAILVALAATAIGTAPALAQRGHGGERNAYGSHGRDRERDRDRDYDRGRHHGSGYYGGGYYRHDWRDNDDWVLGLSLGLGLLSLLDEPDYMIRSQDIRDIHSLLGTNGARSRSMPVGPPVRLLEQPSGRRRSAEVGGWGWGEV